MGFLGLGDDEDDVLKPEVEKDENKETYSINIECSNCGSEFEENEIPIGTTVKEFLKNKKCEECGCLISEED